MQVAILCVLFGVSLSVGPFTSVYKIDSGPIRGVTEDGVNIFHGIPFAAPPVGNLRLKAPQPVAPWTDTLDCNIPPPVCPQFDVTTDKALGHEDCLYLDVYVPEKSSANLRPVFFWIYGGGYVLGDGWQDGKYDGKNITLTHDYIVVSFNYRLGALGFLSLDALKAEDPDNSTGNYALQDQVYALQWVQRNIHVFGGDPKQVTIIGESAGAFSVCWHLVSPASKGLFRAAIMESGTCDSGMFFVQYDRAVSWSNLYSKSVGCDPANTTDILKCLRNLTADQLNHIPKTLYKETGYWLPLLYPVMPWGPVIDGSQKGLLDLPLNLLQQGKANFVPHIAGINQNEGSIFIPAARILVPGIGHEPLTEDDLVLLMGHFFCNNMTTVNTIIAAYPLANFQGVDHQAAIILRDFFFGCPTKRALRAEAKVNATNPYFYQFTYTMHYPMDPVMGDYHSSELNYVWDNAWPLDGHLRLWNASDQQMASTFGVYWSNLVHNLTPNGKETTPRVWPNYAEPNPTNIMLDVPTNIESNWLVQQCQMWDSLMDQCSLCGC